MRGRSAEQMQEYEDKLAFVAAVLLGDSASVKDLVGVLRGTAAACEKVVMYARIEALKSLGYVVRSRKRDREPGQAGRRDRIYWIEEVS